MKKISILICSLMCFVSSVIAQETETGIITSSEKAIYSNSSFTRLAPVKQNRLRRTQGGLIKVQFEGSFTETMKSSINYAVGLWEEQLIIENPVILRFVATSFNDGTAYRANVAHYSYNNKAYTESLYENEGNFSEQDTERVSYIEINSNPEFWDYARIGEVETGKTCLTTATLRAMAIWFGFGGSSLLNSTTNQVRFAVSRYFSDFDNNTVNSAGTFLNTLPNAGPRGDAKVTSFTTGQNGAVYYKNINNTSYKLYAPSTFDNSRSLRFFDTSGDLMSVNLYTGYRVTEIDQKTTDALKDIGWKISYVGLNIIGDDIDNTTGIGSAYSSYSFKAESSNGSPVANYNWKYELVDKNNSYITVKTGNSSTFAIDAVSNPAIYKQSIEGDLKGRITLDAIIDGQPKKSAFNVTLEQKVSQIKVRQVKMEKDNVFGLFSLVLEVEYPGGDYLDVAVEQDNIAIVDNFRVNEKNYTIIKYTQLRMLRTIWFDFTTSNKYGKKTYTYEIDPIYPDTYRSLIQLSDSIVNYKVQSIFGEYMGTYSTQKEVLSSDMKQGIYIIVGQGKDGTIISTNKILKK